MTLGAISVGPGWGAPCGLLGSAAATGRSSGGGAGVEKTSWGAACENEKPLNKCLAVFSPGQKCRMYRAKIFHCFSLFFNYFHCFFTGTQGHFSTFFSHATNIFSTFFHTRQTFFFTRGSHKSLRARGGLLGCVSIALAENITAPALGSEKIIFGRRFFHFAFSRAFYNCVLCFLFNPEADRQK